MSQHTSKTAQTEPTIDVRTIAPPLKHASIFKMWNALSHNNSMLLINDHDPVPLYYQFTMEHDGHFHWEYLEKGPKIWRVRISRGDFSDPGFIPMKPKTPKPQAVEFIEPLVLDARPILEKGGSPCAPIDQAIASLKPGQNFILKVSFKPLPLFAKLARDGFTHSSKQIEDGSWIIEFNRAPSTNIANSHSSCCEKTLQRSSSAKDAILLLDLRGMEPPQPLILALEALQQLIKGKRLKIHTDRKPLHLLDQLDQRAFQHDCTEQVDHSFITLIWHAYDSNHTPCACH